MTYKYSNPLTKEEIEYLEKRKAIDFYNKKRKHLETVRSKERKENKKKRFDVAFANRVIPLKPSKEASKRTSNRSRIASNINNNILNF